MDNTSQSSSVTSDYHEQLGTFLKKKREGQGKTLTDIFNATGISVSTLTALENGDRRRLPADVFVRGFLRLYAKELAIEPQSVLDRYDNDWGAGTASADQAKCLGHEKMARSLFPFESKLLQILAAVLAAGLFFFLLKTFFPALYSPTPAKRSSFQEATTGDDNPLNPTVIFTEEPSNRAELQEPAGDATQIQQSDALAPSSEDTEKTTTPSAPKNPAAEPIPGQTEPAQPVQEDPPPALSLPAQQPVSPSSAEAGDAPKEQTTLSAPTAPPPVAAAASLITPQPQMQQKNTAPYVLNMEFIQQSWVKIALDGQPSAEQVFTSGKIMTWKAAKSIDLQIGNAGGVKVLLNNAPLELEDKSGQIVKLHIP